MSDTIATRHTVAYFSAKAKEHRGPWHMRHRRVEVVDLTPDVVREDAPLYHSPAAQLGRALGRCDVVYCGGVEGGTVRDAAGKYWDWWPTEEVLRFNFRRIQIVPA